MLAGIPHPSSGQRKKLEEAARLWSRGELKNGEEHVQQEADAQAGLNEQFAALGIQLDEPVDVSERLQAFHLWPENLSAWQLFMSVQSQWRGAMQREGLDLPGVQIVISQRREWRLRRRQRLVEVQLMARVCLEEWRAKDAAELDR